MPFTDEDLKRLKEIVSDWRDAYNWQDASMFIEVRRQQLGRFLDYNDALLARLEAAETLIQLTYFQPDNIEDKFTIHSAAERWLKSAGREGR